MATGNETNHEINGATIVGGLAIRNPASSTPAYLSSDVAGNITWGGLQPSPSMFPGVMSPAGGNNPLAASTNVALTANALRMVRVVAPRSGWLRDLSAYCVTNAAGNYYLAVYDCGDATATTYTRLWASSSTTIPATGNWMTPDSTNALCQVVQGQQYMFALAADATATVAKYSSQSNSNANGWPTTRFNTSTQPLRDKPNLSIAASFPPPATVLDSSTALSIHQLMIVGVVADA